MPNKQAYQKHIHKVFEINSNNNSNNHKMSAPGPDFARQQELAGKKHADLKDDEKMYLMRREIDHLRSVIRDQNDGSLQSAAKPRASTSTSTSSIESSTSSSTTTSTASNAMDRATVLTLFLFVGLVVVAIWKRRTHRRRSVQHRTNARLQEEVMTFELQNSLAGGYRYEAPTTTSVTNTTVAQGNADTIRI
ncbi:unnamed protein product [Cylindrotheca closterium]|uniref:Uncharacterized protein n=1 Tax=Cylindrotheca closterium TaxID=2856 RepID=A0AAD2G719_9STRA|nr:unnamed protein product [Cylindrotheca closterium]